VDIGESSYIGKKNPSNVGVSFGIPKQPYGESEFFLMDAFSS